MESLERKQKKYEAKAEKAKEKGKSEHYVEYKLAKVKYVKIMIKTAKLVSDPPRPAHTPPIHVHPPTHPNTCGGGAHACPSSGRSATHNPLPTAQIKNMQKAGLL